MDQQRVKELRQQIKDAKRTGDADWAKELEEELEEELNKKESSMDENPDNDEESIEELYELDPEVQAELTSPMVVGHLLDPEFAIEAMKIMLADTASLSEKVERCLKALVGNSYYKLENHTFGLSADLPVADFARLIRANRANGQSVKHGSDFIVKYRAPLGDLMLQIDQRGCIDAISVL